MYSKSIGRALLLTAFAALVPGAGAALAQGIAEDYAPPDTVWPLPLGSTRPEAGGLYVAASFVSYRQTNPLHDQEVARRGLTIVDPVTVIPPFSAPLPVPTFLGSGAAALTTGQVAGPTNFEPGTKAEIGWKLADGSSISVSWLFITEVQQHAAATFAAPGFQEGVILENSFMFSPVIQFPNEFSGPSNKLLSDTGTASSAPGIWNGASIEREQFLQRTQQWDITYRQPIIETENYRMSGLVGPRLTSMWERYKWTALDLDNTGQGSPNFTADYTNVVSNRLYGIHVGCDQECYIGHGFAADLTVQGALYADSVKTQVKYSLARGAFGADHPGPVSKRARHWWEISPEAQATFGLMWYPIEGVEIHGGYDVQAFFNTLSSHEPIDFNFSAVDPAFKTNTVRVLDGLNLGIAFTF